MITEEGRREEWEEVSVFWELLIGEEAFDILLGPSGTNQVTVDRIKLILASNDEEVPSGQRHFRLTYVEVLDIDRGAVDFIFKDGLLATFLGFIRISTDIVPNHIQG